MKTSHILNIAKVLFWIIFIGLLIKTGGAIIAGIIGFKDANDPHILQAFDGVQISNITQWEYICLYSLLISILCIQSYLAYIVVRIATLGNITNPFTQKIGDLISKASHLALGIGVLSIIATSYCSNVIKKGARIDFEWGAKEFIFLAGVIFIISIVFQRGIELQKDNELTI